MCRDSNRVAYAALSQSLDHTAVSMPGAAIWTGRVLDDMVRRIYLQPTAAGRHVAISRLSAIAAGGLPIVTAQTLLAEAFVAFENMDLGQDYIRGCAEYTPGWSGRYQELFDGELPCFRLELSRPRVPTIDELFGNNEEGVADDIVDLDAPLPEPVALVAAELRRLRINWIILRDSLRTMRPNQANPDIDRTRESTSVSESLRRGFSSVQLGRGALRVQQRSLPGNLVGLDLDVRAQDAMSDDQVRELLVAICRHYRRLYTERTVDMTATSAARWLCGRRLFRGLLSICDVRGLSLPRDVISALAVISRGNTDALGGDPADLQPARLTPEERGAMAALANAPPPNTVNSNRKRRSISI